MTNKEKLCDKLVQQIACFAPSQYSALPAECGHHMIGRGNYLWRWRLLNIMPLTIEEHTMLHAGLLDPAQPWQKNFVLENRNKLLYRHLLAQGISKDDFVMISYEYLTGVKRALETGATTWEQIIAKERGLYGA